MAHARPAAYKNAIATFRVAVDGNMGICRWNLENKYIKNKYIHKARKKKEHTIYIYGKVVHPIYLMLNNHR